MSSQNLKDLKRLSQVLSITLHPNTEGYFSFYGTISKVFCGPGWIKFEADGRRWYHEGSYTISFYKKDEE